VNPLRKSERDSSSGNLSRTSLIAVVFLLLCSVAAGWILIKQGSQASIFPAMALWMLAILIAAASLILSRIGPFRTGSMTIAVGSISVIILGLVTGFLSGDKFDTIRAAVIVLILMILNYRRQGRTA